MSKNHRLDAVRRGSTNSQSAAIDGVLGGSLDRRSFLRAGSILGLSLPAMSLILGACDAGSSTAAGPVGKIRPGGTLRVGVSAPTGPIDPVTAGNQGSVAMLLPAGEYLAQAMPNLSLRPALAQSWSSNDKGTEWTFKLRRGVTFHDGSAMTAADVVATIDRLADPNGGSIALSAYKGILSKGATKALDPHTVRFHLDRPVGNFPYLVSSDTYSSVILPASYDGNYEKSGFPGTGPMRMKSYNARKGATFVRNENYWDKASPASLDQIEFTFYADEQPALLAFQGGDIDVVYQISVQNGRSVMNNPAYSLIKARSAANRCLHLRTDTGPWQDKRVRQALALSVDRTATVKGLMHGHADLGNDSPFAPVFPTTDRHVPQRSQNLKMAKRLLAEAGVSRGFKTSLNAVNQLEVPDLAVLVQDGAKKIGIDLGIKLQDPGAYYGDAKFGSSPWLDATAGITDYGHRSIPNVYLTAQLASDGVWNSSHIKDPKLDRLIGDFVASVDPLAQTKAARDLQTLLLDETPLIYSYFLEFVAVSTNKVTGIVPNATGQLFLGHAALTA